MYNPFAVLQQLQQLQPDGGSVPNAAQFFGTPPLQKKKVRKARPSQAKKSNWANNVLGDGGITRVGNGSADSAKRAREDPEDATELFFDAEEDTDMPGGPGAAPAGAAEAEPMQTEPPESPPTAEDVSPKVPPPKLPPKVLRWLPSGFVETFAVLAGVMRPTVQCEMVLGSDLPPAPKGRRKGKSPYAQIALTPAREHVGNLYAQLYDYRREHASFVHMHTLARPCADHWLVRCSAHGRNVKLHDLRQPNHKHANRMTTRPQTRQPHARR